MKLPDNLPPLPPVPEGFDRWEYRGECWISPGPVVYSCCVTEDREKPFWSGTPPWNPRVTSPQRGFYYIEAVRDQPAESAATGVEARVCADIAARQRLGIAKYGRTVEQSPDDMLRHAYEEALDLAVYLRAELERRGAKNC